MSQDAIYAATRRMPLPSNGVFPKVTKHTGETFNATTGERTPTETEVTVRWVAKETTSYTRLIRGTATETKVGDTTFIFWLPDIKQSFTALDAEDYITYDGVRYDVVSSELFANGLVVTATEQRGGAR